MCQFETRWRGSHWNGSEDAEQTSRGSLSSFHAAAVTTVNIYLCWNKPGPACAQLLTFAEMGGHALGLEQAVVLRLAVALRQQSSGSRWGIGQWVSQGGWRRRWGRGGGGRGGVYLSVDRRDGAGADRNGRRDELSAQAEQTAGDLVNVERGCFCAGAGATSERKRKNSTGGASLASEPCGFSWRQIFIIAKV